MAIHSFMSNTGDVFHIKASSAKKKTTFTSGNWKENVGDWLEWAPLLHHRNDLQILCGDPVCPLDDKSTQFLIDYVIQITVINIDSSY